MVSRPCHCSRLEYTRTSKLRIYNKPVSPLWEWTSRDSVPVEYAAFLPSTSAIKITLGSGVQVRGSGGLIGLALRASGMCTPASRFATA